MARMITSMTESTDEHRSAGLRAVPSEAEGRWPALPYEAWKDTYATLHMWMQVVGKVALAHAPRLNHSWGIALQVTPRGLATHTLTHGARTFAIEFDFIDHRLLILTSDGMRRDLALRPRTVADFYGDVVGTLREMGLPVKIWPVAVEVPAPFRLDQDTMHASYDPVWVGRWWRIVEQLERVLTDARCPFIGKCSPVHFFWGSFDLAVTRFSGRLAPPRDGPAFMREAYSHEVISHGFWPGGGTSTMFGPGPVEEPVFYAYLVPAPAGFERIRVEPSAAFYQPELGEFILPYRAVSTAGDQDRALREFIDSTYAHAAERAGWDRAALERVSG